MLEIFIACCVAIGAIVAELKIKTYDPQSDVETHVVTDDEFRMAVELEMANNAISSKDAE